MSSVKKPRQPRWPARIDNISSVILTVTKLTPAEIAGIIDPTFASFEALRQGVATVQQWNNCASAITVSLKIEDQGVVRGLREHLTSADLALHAIAQRSQASGVWKQSPLWWHEIDSIRTALELHKFQMQHLSAREYHGAIRAAAIEVLAQGGTVYHPERLAA